MKLLRWFCGTRCSILLWRWGKLAPLSQALVFPDKFYWQMPVDGLRLVFAVGYCSASSHCRDVYCPLDSLINLTFLAQASGTGMTLSVTTLSVCFTMAVVKSHRQWTEITTACRCESEKSTAYWWIRVSVLLSRTGAQLLHQISSVSVQDDIPAGVHACTPS